MAAPRRILTKRELGARAGRVCIWFYVIEVGLAVGVEYAYVAAVASLPEFRAAYAVTPAVLTAIEHMHYVLAPLAMLLMAYVAKATAPYTVLLAGSYAWLLGHLLSSLKVGNLAALAAGRALRSLALGALVYTLPQYVWRNSSRRGCGPLLALFQAGVPLGALLMAVLASPGRALRTAWTAGGAPVYPMCALLCYLPRTETRVIRIDQSSDCDYRTLTRVISARARLARELRSLARPRTRRRAWAAVVALLAAGLCGVPATTALAARVAAVLRLPLPEHAGTLLLLVQTIVAAACAGVIPKLPAPPTLRAALCALGACHMAMYAAVLAHRAQLVVPGGDPRAQQALAWTVLALMCVQSLVYALCVPALGLVYAVRRSPPESRGVTVGLGLALSMLAHWGAYTCGEVTVRAHAELLFLVLGYACFALYIVVSCL